MLIPGSASRAVYTMYTTNELSPSLRNLRRLSLDLDMVSRDGYCAQSKKGLDACPVLKELHPTLQLESRTAGEGARLTSAMKAYNRVP